MNLKSKIGLGTVQFGLDYGISNERGMTPKEEVRNILNFAKAEGLEVLDTAIAYGNAESVLGSIGVEKFQVVSKFLPESNLNMSLKEQLMSSLKNLKQESIYGYLAHRPLEILNNPEQWNTLNAFKDQGLVNKIGFSLNEPDELEQLLNKNLVPDLIQVPFNYFDNRFEKVIKKLHADGCEVHTRSAFLQGLFFKAPEKLPVHFEEVKGMLKEIQRSTNHLAGNLLRFVLEKPFIDKVIVGVENKTQLKNNLENLDFEVELPNLSRTISDNIIIPSQWPKIK